VIRQSVSCDICGTEKKLTNHWFVAHEQAGELRLSGWNSRYRSRTGSKHLCGQTCLHKLVDDFMARCLSARQLAADSPSIERPSATDTSLTANAAHDFELSSARLLVPVAPAKPIVPMVAPRTGRAESAVRIPVESAAATLTDEAPDYSSPKRRADAWQRERAREQRSAKAPLETAARSHS
jgi:hypothetical protein